ncbi:hypothetical protein HMPREF0724_11238 [Prescottella equi ATCC 33707]|uniref:Uncharacterized protein n=1 Tax=Prescottella equi ATCC 33707 TaxID=525370 RepID=E9SY23_RHOHA|nr:hypothetical protein HMPREF0724_11238 [Prescottella equi ATCC 33707]
MWAGVVTVPATAGPAPAPPGVDDFYRAPDGFESTSPGTILRERPMRLASYSALPFNAQAWQLLCRQPSCRPTSARARSCWADRSVPARCASGPTVRSRSENGRENPLPSTINL